jgi:hypothetical protein
MCFLNCEGEDLRAEDGTSSGDVDEQEFCQREANVEFICRSSGGGSEIEEGADTFCLRACASETDCSFCRHPDDVATCTDEVSFVEATGVRVCLP